MMAVERKGRRWFRDKRASGEEGRMGIETQNRMRPSRTPRAKRMRTSMTTPRETSRIGTIFS